MTNPNNPTFSDPTCPLMIDEMKRLADRERQRRHRAKRRANPKPKNERNPKQLTAYLEATQAKLRKWASDCVYHEVGARCCWNLEFMARFPNVPARTMARAAYTHEDLGRKVPQWMSRYVPANTIDALLLDAFERDVQTGEALARVIAEWQEKNDNAAVVVSDDQRQLLASVHFSDHNLSGEENWAIQSAAMEAMEAELDDNTGPINEVTGRPCREPEPEPEADSPIYLRLKKMSVGEKLSVRGVRDDVGGELDKRELSDALDGAIRRLNLETTTRTRWRREGRSVVRAAIPGLDAEAKRTINSALRSTFRRAGQK